HLLKISGQAVATPENRWGGVNRGGWVNADYDRFVETYIGSFDRNERNQAAIQGLKIASDQLPAIPLYYLSLAAAHASALEGLNGGYNSDSAWDNVAQWRWIR